MMKQSIFEQLDGKYEQKGDYLLPCLTVPTAEEQPIGIWGCGSPAATSAKGRSTDRGGSRDQWHRRYLKEHNRILYCDLLTSCKLNSYLTGIDQQAEEMFSLLVKQMAEREGVTESLKAQDQMMWVGRMNSIRERATEIVNHDLIYS